MRSLRFVYLLLALPAPSMLAQHADGGLDVTPIPEMAKLAQALSGDWNNQEILKPSEHFPRGAQRRGSSHCEMRTGGTTFLCEGESDGSAGRLDHLIVIWWDNQAQNYGFFICFKDWGQGCLIRGTAHWEGDVFVNDYTEDVKGKPVKMRDSFIDITPASHTLIAAVATADGKMKTLITTRSTRR